MHIARFSGCVFKNVPVTLFIHVAAQLVSHKNKAALKFNTFYIHFLYTARFIMGNKCIMLAFHIHDNKRPISFHGYG